jgi:hypothetical protein
MFSDWIEPPGVKGRRPVLAPRRCQQEKSFDSLRAAALLPPDFDSSLA